MHHLPTSRAIDQNLSDPFSIKSREKLEIKLESSGIARSDKGKLTELTKEHTMTTWVVCGNSESPRTNFKIILDEKALTEVIEDILIPKIP